jgi:uncharacterized protein (TIGR01777 family)
MLSLGPQLDPTLRVGPPSPKNGRGTKWLIHFKDESKIEMARVLITGASGMVGGALSEHLAGKGDIVHRLVRRPPQSEDEIEWSPDNRTIDAGSLNGIETVYHLAGENIAEGRWTEAKKARIRDSRVIGTTLLSETLAGLDNPPSTLVAASALGYYGDRGDDILTEESPPGEGYLPEVCVQWEQATESAAAAGIRVVNIRIGIVLARSGGALAKMLLPFKLGVGGVLGPGTQYMSWITLDDLVNVFHYCATTDELTGPVNGVSPGTVTNKAYTKALGRAVARPTIFPMPAFAARLAFGEMAEALLLSSTRVEPRRLSEIGFVFQHPEIDEALVEAVK